MEGLSTAIAKTLAESGNLNASEALTTEKRKILWIELMNETMKAQAAMKGAEASLKLAENDAVKSAAIKLATEWETGEYTNWKTWVETAESGTRLIKNIRGGGIKH